MRFFALLDPPTLITINFIILVVITCSQFLILRFLVCKWAVDSSEIVFLAWGNLMISAGFFLLLLRAFGLYVFSILGGNILIVLGNYLLFLGLAANAGRHIHRHRIFGLGFTVFLGGMFYYTLIQDSLPIRSALISLFLTFLSWGVAGALWPKMRARNPIHQVLGTIYGAHGLFFAYRFLYNMNHIHQHATMLEGGGLMALASFEAVLFTLVMGMAYLLIIFDSLEERLRCQAQRDHLTGLYNRMAFEKLSGDIFAQARKNGAPVALLELDLDHFKKINDTHGHTMGDQVLSTFARTVFGLLPPEALMARTGGEEFVVLLPRACREEARALGERLRGEVERMKCSSLEEGQRVGITVSVGIALDIPPEERPFEKLFRIADRMLYRAKELGRNRVEMEA